MSSRVLRIRYYWHVTILLFFILMIWRFVVRGTQWIHQIRDYCHVTISKMPFRKIALTVWRCIDHWTRSRKWPHLDGLCVSLSYRRWEMRQNEETGTLLSGRLADSPDWPFQERAFSVGCEWIFFKIQRFRPGHRSRTMRLLNNGCSIEIHVLFWKKNIWHFCAVPRNHSSWRWSKFYRGAMQLICFFRKSAKVLAKDFAILPGSPSQSQHVMPRACVVVYSARPDSFRSWFMLAHWCVSPSKSRPRFTCWLDARVTFLCTWSVRKRFLLALLCNFQQRLRF